MGSCFPRRRAGPAGPRRGAVVLFFVVTQPVGASSMLLPGCASERHPAPVGWPLEAGGGGRTHLKKVR